MEKHIEPVIKIEPLDVPDIDSTLDKQYDIKKEIKKEEVDDYLGYTNTDKNVNPYHFVSVTEDYSDAPSILDTNKIIKTEKSVKKENEVKTEKSNKTPNRKRKNVLRKQPVTTEIVEDCKDSKVMIKAEHGNPLDFYYKRNYNLKCPKCMRTFKLESLLNLHLSHVCGKHMKFQCLHCPYTAKHSSTVRRHSTIVHPDKEVGYLNLTKTSLPTLPGNVKMFPYIRGAANRESRKYECAHCGSKYTRRVDIINHLKIVCGTPKPMLGCPYCLYHRRQKLRIHNHIRKHHPNQTIFHIDLLE